MGGRDSFASNILIAAFIIISSAPFTGLLTPVEGADPRGYVSEGQDNDVSNNDDFSRAQEIASGDYLDGTTGFGDVHRIDTYVIRNVSAGKIINASLQITNFNSQALLLSGWNKYHNDVLAWSNREDTPDRRVWEAISFLCVVTGDYYIQLKPIAGSGTVNYRLNTQVSDAENITSKVGNGGVFGPAIQGIVSSNKWYPSHWYRFQMSGEQTGLNDYLYANLTLPGAPDQRLMADLYVRDLQPETWSYWLNHSWWLDSFVQYEEVHAAACYPGLRWYYLDVQAANSSGTRSENYELRLTKTVIDSDGDNHPRTATPVSPAPGNATVRKTGSLVRGPDMFDWYKVYLFQNEGVGVNLTLNEKSSAIFRLSIYRDNLTATTPEKGYDLMSSWTNKPADTVLNRVNAVATNISQEGWYYIAAIAQIGLLPSNVNYLADWTVQTAWAKYTLDITMIPHWSPPVVQYAPGTIIIEEDGTDSSLELNFTGSNHGVFFDPDFLRVGDALNFSCSENPNLEITINSTSVDLEATVTIRPGTDWNGETEITLGCTDLQGYSCSTVARVSVTPVNDPPYAKGSLPDFCVPEGAVNASRKQIGLQDYFSDPDIGPFGGDNLAFSVSNASFPAWIDIDRLVFGPAPDYPGYDNTTVLLTVKAADTAALAVALTMNITVLDNSTPPPPPPPPDRPPVFNSSASQLEMLEDTVRNMDMRTLFWDPDGDLLNFSYLNGASANLTVTLPANGTLTIRPAQDYFAARETLVLRAADPQGLTTIGELMVRIINVNDPPRFIDAVMTPNPKVEIRINECEPISFRSMAADADNAASELRISWSVDGRDMNVSAWDFNWTTGFNDSGPHTVKARVSDGQAPAETTWRITIVDVNRPPVILDIMPLDGTVAPAGSLISFRASASDPDNDPLRFVWRLSNGTVLRDEIGAASSFARYLPEGSSYIITLNVSDGKDGLATSSFTVEIERSSLPPLTGSNDWTPTFIVLGLVATAAIGGLIAMGLRRRGRQPGRYLI
jgi:hypothetical protein